MYFVVHAQTASKGTRCRFGTKPSLAGWSGDIAKRHKWSAWLLLGVADSLQAAIDMAWEPRSDKIEAGYSIDFDYTITSFKWLNWKLAAAEYYFTPEGLYNALRFRCSWEDMEGNTVHYQQSTT